VLLDAGYADPPFDPSQSLEEYVAQNEADWEEEAEPSWNALLARVRLRYRRWNEAIESSVRAGRLEQGRSDRAQRRPAGPRGGSARHRTGESVDNAVRSG
jgi:hypothetical protein